VQKYGEDSGMSDTNAKEFVRKIQMAGILGVLNRLPNDAQLDFAFDVSNITSNAKTHLFTNGWTAIDCPPYYGQPAAPLVSPDGKHAAVVFGEIFLGDGSRLSTSNFENKFLKPFLRDKTEFLRTLNGGFAFAIMSNDECTIANDPFGTFPLHYTINDKLFAFSTRMLPLLKVANNSGTDQRGLFENLGFSHSLSGRTMFSNINRLKRGTWISVGREVKTEEYIDRSYNPSHDVKTDLEAIYGALTESVQRSATHERVTAALSGGFDSRLTWSLLLHNKFDNSAVASTHGVPDALDVRVARRIARSFGLKHDVITYSDEVLRTLPSLWEDFICVTDGQLGLSHVHSYYSCEQLSKRFSVLIDSYGSARYRRQIKKYAEPRIDPSKEIATQVLPIDLTTLAFSPMLRTDIRKEIASVALLGLREYYATIEHIKEVGNKFDTYYADQTASLRDCFSASMQMNFIGLSQPLYSAKGLDIASRIPIHIRRNEGIHRSIIRRAAPELQKFWLDYSAFPTPYYGYNTLRLIPLGIERTIRNAGKSIPFLQNVSLRRPPISLDQILRPGITKVRETLLSSHSQYDWLIDRVQVERALREFESGGHHADAILQLLTYRMFLELI
jgi:hypothetical protein